MFWLDNIKGNYYEINTISFNLSCLKKKKKGINRDFESTIGLRRLIYEMNQKNKKKKNLRELEPSQVDFALFLDVEFSIPELLYFGKYGIPWAV